MIQMDMISGEHVGSPELQLSSHDTSDQFAVNAADFYGGGNMNGQMNPYFTSMNPPVPDITPNGPGYTGPVMNSQTVSIGGAGYNPSPQLEAHLNYMNQYQQPQYSQMNMGYNGMMSPMYQPPNIPPGMSVGIGPQYAGQPMQPTGFVGNPAFAMLNQWQQEGKNVQVQRTGYGRGFGYGYQQPGMMYQPMQPQYEDKVINVPGYNPSGSIGMLRSDAEEICDKLQLDMMYDLEKSRDEHERRFQGYFNANYAGYNYYGMPYIQSGYQDQAVMQKYRQKLDQMKQEAIDRRREFNKRLSRLCHNYLGDGITDEQIDQHYDGYTYKIPGATIREQVHQNNLSRMVPVDNSRVYREHDAQVTEFFHYICPPNHNMNEFFADLGFLKSVEMLEEEQHRRRDTKQYYDPNMYHEYIRRYALAHNIDTAGVDFSSASKGDIMKYLLGKNEVERAKKNGITINDNGSINITMPDWLKERYPDNYPASGLSYQSTPQIKDIRQNEMEAQFQESRGKFIRSILDSPKMKDTSDLPMAVGGG